MKLYTTLSGGRYFALPEQIALPPGSTPVRPLLGPPERADLDALAPYEIPADEARELAQRLLHGPLGPVESALFDLQQRLNSPEGRRALERLGSALKQIGTDAKIRRALRRLDRDPPA